MVTALPSPLMIVIMCTTDLKEKLCTDRSAPAGDDKSKGYNAYGCRRMCEPTRPTTALVDAAQAGLCE
eukprot:11771458-Heterocapsa_arctica.AAC.1